MKFNIVVIDPPNYAYTHFLFDTIKYLSYGLESLGHDCYISKNKFDSGRINIIFGGHNITKFSIVSAILQSKLNYIVLQSEIVRHETINTQTNKEQFTNIYLPLLENAIEVWDANSINLGVLNRMGIKVELFRLGYHSAMEEILDKNTQDIDFLFFGSITPHRKEMLDLLAKEKFKTEIVFDPVAFYRNDLIARSKIILNIRQGDNMPQLPYTRIVYAVNNKKLVISENCEDQEWLEDIFLHTETEKFIDLCIETIERNDSKKIGLSFYEKLTRKPMTGYLKPILKNLKS